MANDRVLFTRRDFGGLLLAGVPFSALASRGSHLASRTPRSAPRDSRFNGVQIGAITYSYRSIRDASAIVKAMADEGLSEVEVMSNHVEALAGTPPDVPGVRKTFNGVGIDVRLLTYNMNTNMSDEQIEYGFKMAQALGVKAMTTSTQVSMAKRIAPFAEKYKMIVGFHGHDQVQRTDEVSTEATFEDVMAASTYHYCNLDIGHYTAANGDAVAFIEKHHDRITNLHVKDRKKDHGPNMPFGQGDTPIKDVLQLLKKNKYDFPANIEFEYPGDPLVEMPKCIEYCRAALA